jgi:hypothetical protein
MLEQLFRSVSAIVQDSDLFSLVRLHGRMGHSGYRSKKVFLKCRVENRGARRVGDISTVTIDTREIFYDEDW